MTGADSGRQAGGLQRTEMQVPDRFRIVQVVQEFSRQGGVETVAFELQQAWEAEGVPSTVLAGTFGREVQAGQRNRLRLAAPSPILRRVPTRGRWRYAGRALVVPTFTLSASAALVAGRRRSGWAEDAVILSHGDSLVADVVVMHGVNAASLAQKRRDGEWGWAFNAMHLWVAARERWMLGGLRARRYVAVSRRVVQELAEWHGVPEQRVRVIPNGTDIDRFTPEGPKAPLREEFAVPESSPLLLFVGHEFARKGLSHAAAALNRPGLDAAHLVVVGAGEPGPYRRQAAEAGCANRLHFAGPRQDLPSIYRAADAFVFPTAYETFSLVCMEAMACGLPVFAAAAGGIEDYLEDGVNGFAVARDPDSIATALGPVLATSGLLATLARGARQTSLRFGWPEVARSYRDLLLEVWQEKRGEGHVPSRSLNHELQSGAD